MDCEVRELTGSRLKSELASVVVVDAVVVVHSCEDLDDGSIFGDMDIRREEVEAEFEVGCVAVCAELLCEGDECSKGPRIGLVPSEDTRASVSSLVKLLVEAA